jgi:hypothetical protein
MLGRCSKRSNKRQGQEGSRECDAPEVDYVFKMPSSKEEFGSTLVKEVMEQSFDDLIKVMLQRSSPLDKRLDELIREAMEDAKRGDVGSLRQQLEEDLMRR